MIEPIMFFGLGFLASSLLGLDHRAVRARPRGAPDRAPARSRDAALDGGNPGRQGSVARRIRHVDAAARNERRAAQEQEHRPARGTRQEERRHQPAQDRARREGRDHLRARGARQGHQGPVARDRGRARGQDQHVARDRAQRSPTRKPSSPSSTAQLSEQTRDLRQPARRDRRAQDAGRHAEGSGRRARQGRQGAPRSATRARRQAAEKATKELADERGTVQNLGTRVGQLERQLATQTTEAEIMGRRIADMEMRLTEQARLLADRERERDQLRTDVECGAPDRGRPAPGARHHRAPPRHRHRGAARREDAWPRRQLERAREDRAKLQREVTSDEARGGGDLGVRAGRERAAARAHQRRRGRGRAPHLGARRTGLADRHDPRGARARRPRTAPPSRSRRRRTPTARTARAASRIASAPCRRARRGCPPRRDRARRASPSCSRR